MCGILGITGPRSPALVERLLHSMAHRGPDARGCWRSGEWTLGHVRLAIIGLDDDGTQPMVSETGESAISFNGEIYNYLEIADRLEARGVQVDRRYDTAVLLAALETFGTEILADLNGMFAFAWYRPKQGTMLLARDRWGKKPLFYGRVRLDDGTHVAAFASEFRVFQQLPGGPPAPDPLGIARYLVYDGMVAERTVYRGVSKVPAGSWLEIDSHGNVQHSGTYWRLDPQPHAMNVRDAEEEFLERLKRSCELRLRSDVPVGLFLSGGMDSSILAAVWRALRPDDQIQTFTIGFEDATYDERWSAELMAHAIGSEHFAAVISKDALEQALETVWCKLSEPFGDPSIVPTALLCKYAREHVTVALGGDGADELQAGYDPFRAWRPARILESMLPRKLLYLAGRTVEHFAPTDPSNMSLRFKVRHFSQGFLHPPHERIQGWMASFPLPMALEALHPDLAADVDPEEVLEPTRQGFERARSRDIGEVHAQIQTWVSTYLECSILTKVDRASMMHSLEVRSPFLDMDLARFLVDLPPSLIFRSGRGKALMRHVARNLLPLALLRKKKKGFGVPQATWLRTVLRERMEEALAQTAKGGWYNYRMIARLWREHLSGRADYRRALWNFLFSFPFQASAL